MSDPSPTEQAIRVFDEFLRQWIPPAMQPLLFDHEMNPAERVRHAIRGVIDQRKLPLEPPPLGWAVFSQHYDREGIDGFRYDIESAVFPKRDQAANAHTYLTGKRPNGAFVVGEVNKSG